MILTNLLLLLQFRNWVDTIAPTLNVQNVPTATNTAFTATFVFSEDVTGFTLDDILVVNGVASNF